MENETQNTPVQSSYPEPETVGFPPQSAPRSKRPGFLKWIVIIIIGILVIGGAAFFVLNGGEEDQNPEPTSQSISFITTPQPDSVTTPAPTTQAIDKASVSIQVLNGTGISGEAGYLQDQLESAGYTDIKTGNSTGPTVTVTTMTYASSVPAAAVSEITVLLEKVYQQVETKQSSSSGATDVTVVVGLRKGATPKPAASSTPKSTATTSPSPSSTP